MCRWVQLFTLSVITKKSIEVQSEYKSRTVWILNCSSFHKITYSLYDWENYDCTAVQLKNEGWITCSQPITMKRFRCHITNKVIRSLLFCFSSSLVSWHYIIMSDQERTSSNNDNYVLLRSVRRIQSHQSRTQVIVFSQIKFMLVYNTKLVA